jgi:anti-anti-sigma factor
MSETKVGESLQNVTCPVIVVRISASEIRGDALADAIRSELLAVYLQSSAQHIIVDFSNLTFLNSTGFRPLLSLHRQVRQRQGRLVLTNLAPNVAETFAVTRLIDTSGSVKATFEFYADVPTAVAALYRA